jgi:hypothetical protein
VGKNSITASQREKEEENWKGEVRWRLRVEHTRLSCHAPLLRSLVPSPRSEKGELPVPAPYDAQPATARN